VTTRRRGTLRSRLLLGLLAVTACGLLVAGAITWALLRNSLVDRVDERLDGSRFPAAAALGSDLGPLGGPDPGGRPVPGGQVWAEVRDADGTSTSKWLGVVGTSPADPTLPGDLTAASDGSPRFRTVDTDVGELRVLVVRGPGPDQTLLVAASMADVDTTLNRLLVVELLTGAVVLGAVGLLGWWLIGVGLRPLTDMAAGADEITGSGDLSRRVEPAGDGDEVARLGASMNAMLGRLDTSFSAQQASEDRLRRFVADASHELRTPIAAIRGWAELERRGALDDPVERARAMGRIEESASRMGLLVEDLLLLARLDEGRPLLREPVALSEVVDDAVDESATLGADHRWDRTVEPDQWVVGDAEALRRVVANLVTNARVHTPAGTRVAVDLRHEDDSVVLVVRDDGPGIDPAERDHVFDRFWRADAGRTRDRGGSGLGLSIVAGLVDAHGGTTAVTDTTGGGATFTVRLPAAT
jgi:two-component system, OmpR family, sensor kinase